MNQHSNISAAISTLLATMLVAACDNTSSSQSRTNTDEQDPGPVVAQPAPSASTAEQSPSPTENQQAPGLAAAEEAPPVLHIDRKGIYWGTATVSGQKDHLKQFDAQLKAVLGFSDLEANEIGCVIGCDLFYKPDHLQRIVYVFPRNGSGFLSKFSETWDQLQQGVMDPNFRLQFADYAIASNCNPTTEPPPCQDMPFCAIDQCGAKKPNGQPSCSLC